MFPFSAAASYLGLRRRLQRQPAPTTNAPPTATVNPTATSSVVIPEPAMIVRVWGDTYDDTNAALGLTGTWSRVTGQSGDFNSTETTSSTLNSTATLTFSGTSVQWIGTMGPNNGKASVSIDGGAATTVDTYSSTTKRQQLIYTKTGLTNASHTIKITALGTHGALRLRQHRSRSTRHQRDQGSQRS